MPCSGRDSINLTAWLHGAPGDSLKGRWAPHESRRVMTMTQEQGSGMSCGYQEGCLERGNIQARPETGMLGCGSSIGTWGPVGCCAPGAPSGPPLPWLQGASEPPYHPP